MRLLFRKRLVRLHFVDDSPSIDGVYVGTSAGHYVIAKAGLVREEDDPVTLDGEAWVPKERVLFMQVLS